MNWLQWVQLITAIVSQVPALVYAAESNFGPQKGQSKLDSVLTIVGGIAAIAGATGTQIDALIKGSTPIINSQVAAMNSAGAFQATQKAGA